jgi:hypothetical protein
VLAELVIPDTPESVWGRGELYWVFVNADTGADPIDMFSTLVNAPAVPGGIVTPTPTPTPSPTPTPEPIPTPTPVSLVAFIDRAEAWKGNWKGKVGEDGYYLALDVGPDNPRLPAYAAFALTGATHALWSPGPDDPRALQVSGKSGRIAACWYTYEEMKFHVTFRDDAPHRVSFYALDWDGKGARGQTVRVVDAATKAILDTQVIDSFQDGVYLTWEARGDLIWRVTSHVPGANAVVSALFFDPVDTKK